MHKLLQRRLQKHLGGPLPPGLEALLEALSADYEEADRDRQLLERSLELSSQELLAANQRLRDDLRVQDAEAAAIKTQWREFRELIRVLPVAVVVRHEDSVLLANDAFLTALGRTEADVRRARFSELVHPDERAVTLARVAHFERTGEPDPRGETRWLNAQGEAVHLELELAREIRLEGARALLLALRDITEVRRLHTRLAISDRMASVGTMAAGVAHEINNPLSFVLANLEYASDELTGGPLHGSRLVEVVDALGEAVEGANRVREIVRDLKSFSRVTEGDSSPCDVRAVMEGAIKLAANSLRHAAKLERRFTDGCLVRANAGRLGQVFLNLLVNAAQAIPAGAADQHRVTVVIAPRGAEVVVEVQDTGVGMTPEELGRIFDPFFTTKAVGIGTGLGLSICHTIVTQLGGAIEVESRRGEGSVFRVVLPAAHAPGEEPGSSSRAAREPSRRRLLLVDDDALLGRGLARMLGERFELTPLVSPLAALQLLEADAARFDAILCDVMMPELSGEGFYERLRGLSPALCQRVVFMTGGAFGPRAQAFLDAVPNPRLDKPFTEPQLVAALERLAPPRR
jgi:two-component system cell cycle sensor histidine kinase/response regulator CckA